MGNSCACCPFLKGNSDDSDTLSDNSTLAVKGSIEMVVAKKKIEKKLDEYAQKELKRQ